MLTKKQAAGYCGVHASTFGQIWLRGFILAEKLASAGMIAECIPHRARSNEVELAGYLSSFALRQVLQ
jgi:hypothetical protein